MRHRSIKAVHAYWNELRGTRSAPPRSELDPRGLGAALGDVFLLDGTDDDITFRLAGSRFAEALGAGLTGTPFFSIWREDALSTVRYAYESCVSENIPVLLGVRIDAPAPSPALQPEDHRSVPAGVVIRRTRPERRTVCESTGEMVLLPLTHQGGPGARILGAFALLREPAQAAQAPQRLDATAARTLGLAARPRHPLGLVNARIAETIITRRGHLVLMQGDKRH